MRRLKAEVPLRVRRSDSRRHPSQRIAQLVGERSDVEAGRQVSATVRPVAREAGQLRA